MFTSGGKIQKTDGHIDPQTVHVHMYILKNHRPNDRNRR